MAGFIGADNCFIKKNKLMLRRCFNITEIKLSSVSDILINTSRCFKLVLFRTEVLKLESQDLQGSADCSLGVCKNKLH